MGSQERGKAGLKISGQKILAIVTSVMVMTAVIYGIFVAGSPNTARQLKFDRQRMEDLRQDSWIIQRYVTDRGRLPAELWEIMNDPSYSYGMKMNDPETGDEYGYRLVDERHYELCATFSAASDDQDETYYREPMPAPAYIDGKEVGIDPFTLPHPSGRHCYSLIVTLKP